jgi:hypothetical protein
MDLDIKGEIGHLGYVIKLTLVIHKVIHRARAQRVVHITCDTPCLDLTFGVLYGSILL